MRESERGDQGDNKERLFFVHLNLLITFSVKKEAEKSSKVTIICSAETFDIRTLNSVLFHEF